MRRNIHCSTFSLSSSKVSMGVVLVTCLVAGSTSMDDDDEGSAPKGEEEEEEEDNDEYGGIGSGNG